MNGASTSVADRWAQNIEGGLRRLHLIAPSIRCMGCVGKVERALPALEGVVSAQVNLTLRRIAVTYDPSKTNADAIISVVEGLGYLAKPFDSVVMAEVNADAEGRELLICLAVAGFAAANVMLLSLSVWSGAVDATRDLMHWVSALIALPAVAYAGRPFFRSAFGALRRGRLNMDVPISLAVLLAAMVSLIETASSGRHAYFDASVTLLFFLLIGRVLDHRIRSRARSAAAELAALSATSAIVLEPKTGKRLPVAIEEVRIGDVVEVLPGERVPVDGVVLNGRSDLDRSLVTGESVPETVAPGGVAHAGTLNLTGPLQLKATASQEDTLLGEIGRMIEAAERSGNRYTRLADRAARIYAPGIHIVALLAFIGWYGASGDFWTAVMIASALLIITCPCALGLAAPAVQAAAGSALFRAGVLLKDGAALEKLAQVDLVAFDKTGTLTTGRPRLLSAPSSAKHQALARGLARASRHVLSQTLERALETPPADLKELFERPGEGVEGRDAQGRLIRLGSAAFCHAETPPAAAGSCVFLAIDDAPVARFEFEDALRPDTQQVVEELNGLGLEIAILSGDRTPVVAQVARELRVAQFEAGMRPQAKLERLEQWATQGRRVLMVGDGINDAPALAAAHASMSPASAADISRVAADFVFTTERLTSVLWALRVARAARWRMLENFGLAALYNLIAIPLAAAGLATPLVAAIAMSSSSILVTLNALRVSAAATPPRQRVGDAPSEAQTAPILPAPKREAQI